MFNRKGQAALEFLTTYGWAFLVILVMIGGLWYFGVFNFTDKLPDKCTLDNKLGCGQIFVISDSNSSTLQMQVQNNALNAVTISNATLIEKSIKNNGGSESDCSLTVSGTNTINPDEVGTVKFDMETAKLASCGISPNVDSK